MKIVVKPPKNVTPTGAEEERILNQALHAVGVFAIHRLTKLAQERLSPLTGQTYIHGLNASDSFVVAHKKLTITLSGDLANTLESGTGPWDIKQKMLARTTKRSKAGKPYADVPFEHGAPGTTGKAPMPDTEYFLMQKRIKDAKQNLARVRGPKTMPTRPEAKRVKMPGTEKVVSYTPKRGPYDDMVAVKSKEKTNRRRYLTIRRISENSDPASWIHPGTKGLKLFPQVLDEVEKLAPRVIQDYLDKL